MDEGVLNVSEAYELFVDSQVIESIPAIYLGKKRAYFYSNPKHFVLFRSLITGEPEISAFKKYVLKNKKLKIRDVSTLPLSDSMTKYLEERLKRAGL